MTTHNAAVTAAELAALGSVTVAALVVWLLLARPHAAQLAVVETGVVRFGVEGMLSVRVDSTRRPQPPAHPDGKHDWASAFPRPARCRRSNKRWSAPVPRSALQPRNSLEHAAGAVGSPSMETDSALS